MHNLSSPSQTHPTFPETLTSSLTQVAIDRQLPGSDVEAEAVVAVASDDAVGDDVGSVQVDGREDDELGPDRRLAGQIPGATVLLEHGTVVVGSGGRKSGCLRVCDNE